MSLQDVKQERRARLSCALSNILFVWITALFLGEGKSQTQSINISLSDPWLFFLPTILWGEKGPTSPLLKAFGPHLRKILSLALDRCISDLLLHNAIATNLAAWNNTYYLTVSVVRSSAQISWVLWKAAIKMSAKASVLSECWLAHSGWHNSVHYSCKTEGFSFLLAVGWRLPLAPRNHPQFHFMWSFPPWPLVPSKPIKERETSAS